MTTEVVSHRWPGRARLLQLVLPARGSQVPISFPSQGRFEEKTETEKKKYVLRVAWKRKWKPKQIQGAGRNESEDQLARSILASLRSAPAHLRSQHSSAPPIAPSPPTPKPGGSPGCLACLTPFLPSWPRPLSPQDHTVPSVSSSKEWRSPLAARCSLEPLTTRR